MSAVTPSEPDAAGFVLAGGRSSRMGRDKAFVEMGGRTLAAHAVHLLQGAGLSASFAGAGAGARARLAEIAPVIPDQAADQGPLHGVCSALAQAGAEFAVFVPVDMPLLPPSLLAYLLRHAVMTRSPVTLGSVNGFAQTFPAVLRRETLPILQQELAAGRGGCIMAFRFAAEQIRQTVTVVPVEMLVQAGQVKADRAVPPYRWFLNVNTPEDVEQALLGIG